MSDFIFVTEKAESSEKNHRITKKSGKERHTQGEGKMAGKRMCAHLARKLKQRHLIDD